MFMQRIFIDPDPEKLGEVRSLLLERATAVRARAYDSLWRS